MHSDKKFYGNVWKKFFDYCLKDTDYIDVLGFKLGEEGDDDLNDDFHKYARENNLYEIDDHSYNTNGIDFDIDDDYEEYDEDYEDHYNDDDFINLPTLDDEDYHNADLVVSNDTVKFSFHLNIEEKEAHVMIDFYDNRDLVEELIERLDEVNSKGIFEIEPIFNEETETHLFKISIPIDHLNEFSDDELAEVFDLFIQTGVYLKTEVLNLLFFE